MSIEDQADFHYWRAADLFGEHRSKEALAHLEESLAVVPDHIQALNLAGDIYTLRAEELGLDPADCLLRAMSCFDRVLARHPAHAEAWSGKALVYLYMGRAGDALSAADMGIASLPARVGYGMTSPEVHSNVAADLYSTKVGALLRLGRRAEATEALAAGLTYCPDSRLLHLMLDDEMLPRGLTDTPEEAVGESGP
jgi:tetratricopeptide (TPR) repeat protein